jgi:predicted nuclease with TOPRIM domain
VSEVKRYYIHGSVGHLTVLEVPVGDVLVDRAWCDSKDVAALERELAEVKAELSTEIKGYTECSQWLADCRSKLAQCVEAAEALVEHPIIRGLSAHVRDYSEHHGERNPLEDTRAVLAAVKGGTP